VKKLVVALALFAAACGITDSNTFHFSFSATPLDAAPASPKAATVETDTAGIVLISGDANTPCADQGVTMSGTRQGSELHVTVNRAASSACSGGVRWYSYQALMLLPQPGTYHLLMTDLTGGSAVTILDQQVQVKGA
jgi:hypothetical protein